MGLILHGKVVSVETCKTDKGRHYKRLQLLSNGGNGPRLTLWSVTDMTNGETWTVGADVRVPVGLQVYSGKNGPGYSLTHWGASGEPGAGSGEPGAGSRVVK